MYAIIQEEQANEINAEQFKTNLINADEKCLTDWWAKPYSILEIKNEDDHYYNFITRAFQATKSSLEKTITNGSYVGYITFPTVTDDDNYDIYLYAKPGSQHSEYN